MAETLQDKFAYFYLGDQSGVAVTNACPTPLRELMIKRWNNFGFTDSYQLEYTVPTDEAFQRKLFSAYRPGQEHDSDESGIQKNALSSSNTADTMIRNYYSTKFVSLRSLSSSERESYGSGIGVFSEGDDKRAGSASDTSQGEFKNPISPDSVDLDLSKIKH